MRSARQQLFVQAGLLCCQLLALSLLLLLLLLASKVWLRQSGPLLLSTAGRCSAAQAACPSLAADSQAGVLLLLSPCPLPGCRAALSSLAMLRHIGVLHCRHLAGCQLMASFESAHCLYLLLPAAYKEVKASAKDQKGSKLKLLEVCTGHNLVVTERLVSLDGPASATFFERAEEVEECNVSAGATAGALRGCARHLALHIYIGALRGCASIDGPAQSVRKISALVNLRTQVGFLKAVWCFWL